MKKLLLVIYCFVSVFTYGQLGTWNIVNSKLKLNEKWSCFTEAQLRSLRFYNHFHYYECKGGVNYKLFSEVAITFGGGSCQTYGPGGNFNIPKNRDEIRIWPQISLSKQYGKMEVEQRYRMEGRFTDIGYRNRYRVRLSCSYVFPEKITDRGCFKITASNELFFTNKAPFFERNRSTIALYYFLSTQLNVMVGFLNQFDYKINDETGTNFLQIGLNFDLSLKNEQILK